MLSEHLWALVLSHLDTLRDHIKASTSCRAAWKAGLFKLDIPVNLPTGGVIQLICIYSGQCVLHINTTGRVLTCRWCNQG